MDIWWYIQFMLRLNICITLPRNERVSFISRVSVFCYSITRYCVLFLPYILGMVTKYRVGFSWWFMRHNKIALASYLPTNIIIINRHKLPWLGVDKEWGCQDSRWVMELAYEYGSCKFTSQDELFLVELAIRRRCSLYCLGHVVRVK